MFDSFAPTRRSALGLLAGVVPLAAAATRPAVAAEPDPIRIGVLQTSGAGPMYLAIDRGYFKDEGFAAEIVTFDNAQTLAVSIASGDLQFGATSLSAGFYNLAAQNLLRIISAQGRDNPGFPNNGVVVSNEAWDKGLTPSTFALSLVRNNQAHLLGWIGDETPWQLGAAYTSTKIADDKGEMVRRFLRAYVRGMHDYADAFITPDGKRKDGPTADAVLALLSKDLNQPVELLRAGMSYVDREGRLDGRDIRRQIDWYKAQGLYQGNVDSDKLLDKRYVVLLP